MHRQTYSCRPAPLLSRVVQAVPGAGRDRGRSQPLGGCLLPSLNGAARCQHACWPWGRLCSSCCRATAAHRIPDEHCSCPCHLEPTCTFNSARSNSPSADPPFGLQPEVADLARRAATAASEAEAATPQDALVIAEVELQVENSLSLGFCLFWDFCFGTGNKFCH